LKYIKGTLMKLAVFDFDSTLMDGETIDFLARELGLEKQVAAITHEAMEGRLDFFNALQQRVKLLKGLDMSKVDDICQKLPLINGAKYTIDGLKSRGYTVVCFSGGFRNATMPACKSLGIDADFSNTLYDVDGILTGEVGGEMMFGSSKGELLIRLQSLLGVSKANTVAVGDGANDLSMFVYAGTKIAFCAKPILRDAATHCVDEKDLRKVLEIVDSIS
jgi:phosphoserine phosphatase